MTLDLAYFSEESPHSGNLLSDRTLVRPRNPFKVGKNATSIPFSTFNHGEQRIEDTIWIRSEGVVPLWAGEAANSLVEILNLAEDWDSYGAHSVELEIVFRAFEVLCSVMSDIVPMPSIVPTSSGGIQLEWHESGTDLEVEITPSGELLILSQNDDETLEHELSLDSPEFSRVLSNYLEQMDQSAGC